MKSGISVSDLYVRSVPSSPFLFIAVHDDATGIQVDGPDEDDYEEFLPYDRPGDDKMFATSSLVTVHDEHTKFGKQSSHATSLAKHKKYDKYISIALFSIKFLICN